ncbi:hypothetical protein ZOSMA_35G00650 [Zostera marina]|uniref:CSC1-like protein RXW8 n=1 Tax=Zostera marina TaxID=29655 RepID=A0A0K9P6I2_ZOSMR|nr:hypothetical protein ZOSMA_35G00650 [Zostera marina]
MKISALLTSAGINIGLCVVFLMLYSVLRKQPGNLHVYFGGRIAKEQEEGGEARERSDFSLDRFLPSPSWIVKAWKQSDDDILYFAGIDAVVFIRIIVFCIRIFSIALVICLCFVLPVNYFGDEKPHPEISSESLNVFTIANVNEKSRWIWVHCLALYIISFSACILLYFEYKNIAGIRSAYFSLSSAKSSHFTVLVRAIPSFSEGSFSGLVHEFFSNYHASSYLSHQVIYKTGKVHRVMENTEKAYDYMKNIASKQKYIPIRITCCLCGGSSSSFQLYRNILANAQSTSIHRSVSIQDSEKDCVAAFVFFKTRYAAAIASQVLQTSNPMLWVTDNAPEPHDIFWSNLCIPYRQLWIRRIITLIASIVIMFLFIIPVTFVQGLSQLEQLERRLPFLRGVLKMNFVDQLVTGYLPSVILMLFMYIVPPVMMFISSLEGSVISQLNVLFSPNHIPSQLAKAVPRQATLFITYVLTSGWASLASEVMQLFPLILNFIKKHVFKIKVDSDYLRSFPYHTELPRVLLFGLLGFTCSILAPVILPFLLAYFFLAYIVYRNQILNVYRSGYETGGQMWPLAHSSVIFSLLLAQTIALGVFGIKKSPIAAGFVIPLLIFTLLFQEFCRKRFLPIFKFTAAQDVIDRDRDDEKRGLMEDIHVKVQSEYLQSLPDNSEEYDSCSSSSNSSSSSSSDESNEKSSEDCSGSLSQFIKKSAVSNRFALQRYFSSLALLITN